MIAKIISRADERSTATRFLSDYVREVLVWPVKTNAAFLVRLLALNEFATGDITTSLIADKLDELVRQEPPTDAALRIGLSHLMEGRRSHKKDCAPWGVDFAFQSGSQELIGFRLNAPPNRHIEITDGKDVYQVQYEKWPRYDGVWSDGVDGGELVKDRDDIHYLRFSAWSGGPGGESAGDGAIVSPMPGKLIAVAVQQGDAVTKGQKLVTLEAMKMEHSLTAPFDGIVAELNAAEGAQVSEGALLARIEKGEGA
jgi:3-methylcrotonyl-CoA carboxylase alpha subunit